MMTDLTATTEAKNTRTDSFQKVPELSLNQYSYGSEQEKAKFIQDLFAGLKHYGFIILKDHPIDTDLLAKAYSLNEQLFSLPESVKKSYIHSAGGGRRGYTPFGKEHAKDRNVPDLKEFWHVGRELSADHPYQQDYPQNIWPQELDGFRDCFLEFYNKLDEVGNIMLEALTYSLDVKTTYFKDLIEDGNSILRLLHYPPIPEGVDPNCVRAAAHEDINLITILVSASSSGLELLDRQGKWLPIETDANNLIVDAGDMLSRITNDVIPSTTHRVVNPDDGSNSSRYSMPFFIHPHSKGNLSCIESCRGDGAKYPDILSQEFLSQRLEEIGLT